MAQFKTAARLVVLGALATGIVGQAATLTLTGTVRDFTPAHPDFESFLGSEAGIVSSTLGGDGKPVYAGGVSGTATTSGLAAFDLWFHRPLNPGVDSTTYDITLSNAENPDVYTFSSGAFFPIDGQLLGNYALGHNYHFTYELHTLFTYTGPENFSFSGDDDVWVFINNQLVIDLGGVHGEEFGSVDTGGLGLTIGQEYPLDFFFAERHTSGSNFSMSTGLVLEEAPIEGAVPEPATWIGAAAVAGLMALRRRRSA